jgi:hypothetical protein
MSDVNEEMTFDEAIESGSMDQIEAALAAEETALAPTETDKPVVAEGETPEAIASSSASEEEGTEQGEKADPEGVLSKKGDRVLPYSELTDSREAARLATEKATALEAELETLRNNPSLDPALATELDRQTRLADALSQQVLAAGLKPQPLPEEFTIDPEKLKELAEYGEVGEVVAMLAKQNQYLMGRNKSPVAPAAKESVAPNSEHSDVIASSPDLTRWADSKYAIGIVDEMDEYVKTLPEFQGKSLAERKDKVVELTKVRLGEAAAPTKTNPADVAAQAEALIAASGKPPTSLSEVGGANSADSSEKTLGEQMQGMDAVDLAEFMDKQMRAGVSEAELLSAF